MKRIVIMVFDQFVLENLEKEFSEKGIKCASRYIADKSFPSLNNSVALAEITLESEKEAVIDGILTSEENRDFVRVNKFDLAKPKKRSFFKTALILYSILMTGLFLKYWHINYTNSTDKNFAYEWTAINTRLNLINKATGHTDATQIDENYNLNYELLYTYHEGQGPVFVSYDNNEDGYYEKVEQFDLKGNLVSWSLDLNDDNWIDQSFMVTEEGDTLILEDKDKDGLMEVLTR